ncbi:uncharacterized protein SAMN05216421_0323 [Halopseudomonas xinjiangensis]|uniref:MYND finger n=1 Tax=Halopseudomonas xinjiangensis TaxID=487184 RepID=A0A1H1LYI2_9GAMM|nr:PP0621 family protein [Halopseudomonas xinjiangensis]SDR79457.1 uncharacterized protein SAMN05216421_0323 [Halopseudomonas xinjiangensis]
MGLIKFILLLIVLFAAFTFWRQWQAWQASKRRPPPAAEKPPLMVRCVRCGLHLPEGEAIREEAHWYCSVEHLEADRNG